MIVSRNTIRQVGAGKNACIEVVLKLIYFHKFFLFRFDVSFENVSSPLVLSNYRNWVS